MINYALPGTIVGIAYLIAFNDPPIELTGTALIIVACYIFRYGPTGIRATVALLSQIDKSLEEASQGLGAGSGTTFRRITLPLILPAFFAGLGVVFIRSMTAISATIFLVSISWTLITVKILENITELSLGPAAAFSVLVVVIVFVVIGLIGRALRYFRAPGRGVGDQHARRMTQWRWTPSACASTASPSATRIASRARSTPRATSTLDVRPGEFLTLLGPSGCGKTTTLRMIAGFETPDAGRSLLRRRGRHRQAGEPAQHRLRVPELRAVSAPVDLRERRLRPARARPGRTAEIARAVGDVLALVGLAGYEQQFSGQLSGGEQQRVALARAIVIRPRVLLFDEPLSNLDAKLRVQMRHEIRALQRRLAITTVYVTHDQEEAMAVSDRIAVMNQGSVVQEGNAPRTSTIARRRTSSPSSSAA